MGMSSSNSDAISTTSLNILSRSFSWPLWLLPSQKVTPRPQLIPLLMPGMDTMAIPDTTDIDITDGVDTMDIVMDTDTGAARRGRLTPPSSPHLQPSLPLKL